MNLFNNLLCFLRSKKPMDFFPTCFYADDKEIILENLVKDKGYYLNSKLDRQDLETVK